jgi:hypothetical protein
MQSPRLCLRGPDDSPLWCSLPAGHSGTCDLEESRQLALAKAREDLDDAQRRIDVLEGRPIARTRAQRRRR